MRKSLAPAASLDIPWVLDICEKIVLVALFLRFNTVLLPALRAHLNPVDIVVLLSEGPVVVFALTHRATSDISLRRGDWTLAIAGSFLPLLVVLAFAGPALPAIFCAAVMTAGFLAQIAAKLTLRRSFGLVAANRGVKVGGPYRLVRHPMYAGYLMTNLAFLAYHPALWNLGVYVAAFAAQCFRLLAEERLLCADEAYRSFMKTTRYRLIPFVF